MYKIFHSDPTRTGVEAIERLGTESRVVGQMMSQNHRSRRRRVIAIHEAGHAVTAELLIPGLVDYVDCFKETQTLQAGDRRVVSDLVGVSVGGGVHYSNQKADECYKSGIDSWNLFVLYRIAVAFSGGMFEENLGISTPEQITRGRKADLENVVRMYEACGILADERKRWTRSAAQIAEGLVSSKVVRDVVQKLADIMFDDFEISGEQIRQIIATDLGSRNEFLVSLGIPIASTNEIADGF